MADQRPQIEWIDTGKVDPESTVNVRRTKVEENRKVLADSIRRHGFRAENPVLLRPHPKGETSPYDYECVSGRSRFLGAIDAEVNPIPCIVEHDLDDERAHILSFAENDKRGAIEDSDLVYWYDLKFRGYRDAGHTSGQAKEQVAKFYGVSPATVTKFLRLRDLPTRILELMDESRITDREAGAIADQYAATAEDTRYDAMWEATEWMLGLSESDRKRARDAIKKAVSPAGRDELDASLKKVKEDEMKGPAKFGVEIPRSAMTRLEALAEKRGVTSPEALVPHLIGEVLNADETL